MDKLSNDSYVSLKERKLLFTVLFLSFILFGCMRLINRILLKV